MGALPGTQLTGSRLGKNAVAKVPRYIQIEKRGGEKEAGEKGYLWKAHKRCFEPRGVQLPGVLKPAAVFGSPELESATW